MNTPNIGLYAGGPLGPTEITTNLSATQQAGWTTIILGLFHIGNPQNTGQNWGDIIFNDSMVVSQGSYVAASGWPNNVAQLKQAGSVVSIYASVGGGEPVVDFTTLQTIYENNGNTFSGTMLEKNFQVLRQTFPAIDGIDMDCEDNYDQPSFVAFCEMLIGMGFAITFCPFDSRQLSFWTGSLAAIEQNNPGAVKWWNLQCYSGGGGNDPQTWANAITSAMPGFSTGGFIVAGDGSRWYNKQFSYWDGDCPTAVTTLISSFSGEACLGGGFIWNMDQILDFGPETQGCGSVVTMADYVNAIKKGL